MTKRFDDPEEDDPNYDPDDPAQFDPRRPKKRRTYDEILGKAKPGAAPARKQGSRLGRLVLALVMLAAAGSLALVECDCAHFASVPWDPGILCP